MDLEPILQHQQEHLLDEVAQPLTQPAIYFNHTTKVEPQQPPPKPTLNMYLWSLAAQSRLSLTEIEEDCIREQTEWLAIEDESKRTACEGELRGRQEESKAEEPEEIAETHGMGLEQHQDKTSDTQSEPNRTVAIELLAPECAVSGVARGDWEEEMKEEMGLTLQSEYMTTYSPPTDLPSPAP
jgi:hypothetical protein